jgi:hypothetical protein
MILNILNISSCFHLPVYSYLYLEKKPGFSSLLHGFVINLHMKLNAVSLRFIVTPGSMLNLLIMFGDVNAYSTMRGLAFSKGQRLS